jgi:hypothetical protein
MRVAHPEGLDLELKPSGAFSISVRPTLDSTVHEVIKYLDRLPKDCRLHFDRETNSSRVFRCGSGFGCNAKQGIFVERQPGSPVRDQPLREATQP